MAEKLGFDNEKYLDEQSQEILERAELIMEKVDCKPEDPIHLHAVFSTNPSLYSA